MLNLLRPKPFRGDQVAAGTVCLTLLIALVDERFDATWSDVVRLVVVGLAFLFVLAMAIPVPDDGGGSRAYLSTLYICSWVLLLLWLFDLLDAVDGSLSAGNLTWIAGALTALALFYSRERDAASGTLLACIAGAVTVIAFCDWVDIVGSIEAVRRTLLLIAIAFGLGALWARVRGPAHGVQLLNVAGLVVIAMSATFLIEAVLGLFSGLGERGGLDFGGFDLNIGWGWAAVILGTGVALVAAGAVDAERGNVVIGIANLVVFLFVVGSGNLVGWPIPLGLGAVVLLVIGLRPSTPLPPEPDHGGDPGGPPLTLRPQ